MLLITSEPIRFFLYIFISTQQLLLNRCVTSQVRENQYYSSILQEKNYEHESTRLPYNNNNRLNTPNLNSDPKQYTLHPTQLWNFYQNGQETKRQEHAVGNHGENPVHSDDNSEANSFTTNLKLLGVGGITKILLAIFPFLITLIFIPLLLTTIGVFLIPVIRLNSFINPEEEERSLPLTSNQELKLAEIVQKISPEGKQHFSRSSQGHPT